MSDRTDVVQRTLEHTLRDILYALRTFRRAPLVSLTVVATVALGLGLVAAAFTVLNALLFRVDAVPDVQALFALRMQPSAEDERFTRARLDALRRETDVFTDLYGEQSQVDVRIDGRLTFGTFVTGNFFEVLGVQAALGRTLTPADDEPFAGRAVMVLSDRGWDRLFARDPAILDRRLLLNGRAFEIVGVMPKAFRGLTIAPDDYWAPISVLHDVRPAPAGGEAAIGLEVVGRLEPGVSREAAVARLAIWKARSDPGPPGHGSRITLVPRRGTVEQPLEVVPITAPLFFAFGLILLIGCANVANLLLARGVARQREIGIRRSLGATRARIIRQMLTESLLLALVAAVAGLAISRVVLTAIITAVMTSMPPDLGDVRLLIPGADWRVLLFLVAGAVLSTLAFALAPALQATNIEPLRTIRGELVREVRPGRARSVLIGVQVCASAMLLICAAVFLRSALASATFDPGMRTSDTLVVQIANEANRQAIVQAVTAAPSVTAVAASWSDPVTRVATAAGSGASVPIEYKFASPESFSVLDVAIARGRVFTPAERTRNLPIAVVSDTTARALWPRADAVGQIIRVDRSAGSEPGRVDGPPFTARTFTVVGVARDVAGFRITPFNKAVVYVPTSAEEPETSLVARVQGDPELARQRLLDRLTTIDPEMGRQVVTMKTLARMDAVFLQAGFWLTVVLGGLALALTLSGLFSVLTYLVAQRTAEIGVRIALGATTRDVTWFVLSQSMRPVGLGLLIGGGLAAALAAVLLASPAAEGIGGIVQLTDPIAYGVSLLVIVVACLAAASIPAMRAARLDPALTLRRE